MECLREQFDASCREVLRAGGAAARSILMTKRRAACERKLLRQAGKSRTALFRDLSTGQFRELSPRAACFRSRPTPDDVDPDITTGRLCIFGAWRCRVRPGTAPFQIYNIFDGCDGEIARAKYPDCEGSAP